MSSVSLIIFLLVAISVLGDEFGQLPTTPPNPEWSVPTTDNKKVDIRVSNFKILSLTEGKFGCVYEYDANSTATIDKDIMFRLINPDSDISSSGLKLCATSVTNQQSPSAVHTNDTVYMVCENIVSGQSRLFFNSLGGSNYNSLGHGLGGKEPVTELGGIPLSSIEGSYNLKNPIITTVTQVGGGDEQFFTVIYLKEISPTNMQLRALKLSEVGDIAFGPISISDVVSAKTNVKVSNIVDSVFEQDIHAVVWEDDRNSAGGNGIDVYASALTTATLEIVNGWNAQGTLVLGGQGDQLKPVIAAGQEAMGDNFEVYIACESIFTSSPSDVVFNKMDKNGQPTWNGAAGFNVMTGTADQKSPSIDSKGLNFVITYEHQEGTTVSNWDIYAGVINTSTGAVTNRAISTKTGDQTDPKMITILPYGADYTGGSYITWSEAGNIYAQKIGYIDNGPVWANSGVVVCTNSSTQSGAVAIEDSATPKGDILVAWFDSRDSATETSLYCQIVSTSGLTKRPNEALNPSMTLILSGTKPMMNLTWGDDSDIETGYKVQRAATSQLGTYTDVSTLSANAVSLPNIDITGFGTGTHYLRVRSYKTEGSSTSFSPVKSANLKKVIIFDPPTELIVLSTTLSTVELKWKKSNSSVSIDPVGQNLVSQYKVARKKSTDASYTEVGTIQVTAPIQTYITWTDTGLQSNIQYQYKVRAMNPNGIQTSEYTTVVNATTSSGGSNPPPPPNNNGNNNTGNNPTIPNNNPNNPSAPSNSTFIPDPQTTTQAGSSGNSSTSSKSKSTPTCYIATASSKNPKSTIIGSLVNIRRGNLSSNLAGKLFSITYHKSSPSLAKQISKINPVKTKCSLLLLMLLISIAAVLSRVIANK
ncbi:MAG: fibronectin type III domain-containing protein [Planctomycetes bacterium]|nr:fibronectin type III domain-containing protein [Planctomycetota bacterium]